MPIFHFDIADGVRLEDPVGLRLRERARREANRRPDRAADRQRSPRRHEPRSVVVVDEAGSEIYTAPVKT